MDRKSTRLLINILSTALYVSGTIGMVVNKGTWFCLAGCIAILIGLGGFLLAPDVR